MKKDERNGEPLPMLEQPQLKREASAFKPGPLLTEDVDSGLE